MKKLLSKVFFVSDCARGAAFALTLLTLGNCVLLSLFHLLLLCSSEISIKLLLWGCDPGPLLRLSALGVLLITVYSFALAVVSLVGFIKILRRERRFKALWHLVPAGVFLALGAVGFVRLFPPLYVLTELGEKVSNPSNLPARLLSGGIPGLPPEYRAAAFFLSLLLILAGGLFLTAAFTTAAGKRFRSAFGAATLTVWGIFAVWYLAALGLALRESREVVVVRQAVEKRFGRPLTAAGLEKLYRESGKVDAEFWPRWEKLGDALPKVKIDHEYSDGSTWSQEHDFWSLTLPDRPTKETFAWYENYCRTNRVALDAFERCFDREPPLPEMRFVRGNLVEVALPTLSLVHYFVRSFESSRLIRHLAVGDVDAAWACYLRMGNAGAYLRKQPCLLGSMVWLRVGQLRLDCMEKLLESRLLADAKLDELDADLAALERDIPPNHQQAMYTEAVFGQDSIAGLEDGLIEERGYQINPSGGFAPYRWIFPQWWYHAAKDKKNTLRVYLLPDLMHFRMDFVDKGLLLSSMMLPVLEHSGKRFYALTARVRGMRALIRAEKYRRKHGAFPKTLPNLPEDPFTGKPLIYEVGKTEIIEHVWKKTVEMGRGMMRTVNVVQVRSDTETTIRLKMRNPETADDLTRAMIRY